METISATIVGESVTIKERADPERPRPRLDDPEEFALIRKIYLIDDNPVDVGARHRKSQLGTNPAR